MTKLLIRLLVPNWQQAEDSAVRGRYGTMAALVGIFCNVLLFAAKLVIGIFSRSVSIMADAVNNLSDASSSVITLVGFRLAQKPPDEEHPYGHARVEYISGLGVAALILVIGVQLCKSSVEKIMQPEAVLFSPVVAVVLALSIVVKLWLSLFNRNIGKRISSMSLIATAADSRNDVITTAAVLLSAVISHVTGLMLDGYIGLLVAVFILYSGVQIGKETISPLLGEPADSELVESVRREILGFHPMILGVHDLMVHDYGPGQRFASVHAEIDYREDVLAAHEVIDNVERMVQEKFRIALVTHYDPIVTDDAELNGLKETIVVCLAALDVRLSTHDFRMVRGETHTNLIFDVVMPYEMQGQEAEIEKRIHGAIQREGMIYHTVITFDSSSFN